MYRIHADPHPNSEMKALGKVSVSADVTVLYEVCRHCADEGD